MRKIVVINKIYINFKFIEEIASAICIVELKNSEIYLDLKTKHLSILMIQFKYFDFRDL